MEKDKIFLVTLSPKSHRTSEENLGIEYLKAALLKEKIYTVEVIDAWLNELDILDVYKIIEKDINKTLFVGFSSYMSNTKPTIELIGMLKENYPDVLIVCGGFGPTFYPKDHLENGADYVIRGEGEEAIVSLAKEISNSSKNSETFNVSFWKDGEIVHNKMKPLVENLDVFPFPVRDNLETVLKNKSTVNMVTSRGCSGGCEFCSVISFFRKAKGHVWRTRSIKNIVDEIELLSDKGVSLIKMVDDSFIDGTRDEEWARCFADEVTKRNINVQLRGQIRADKVSEGILANLKRAGFFSFACGIENGSDSALKRMNKRASLEDNEKALALFKKYDYLVQMGFILFDKDTTLEELEENYRFLRKYDFAVTKGIFSEMFSAEGTNLNRKLRNDNKLIESDFILNNNKYELEDIMVKEVYDCLKLWHKSHSEIYDMTIDPLTAPKLVNSDERNAFYEFVMKLKKADLEIFGEVLKFAKEGRKDILDFIYEEIDSRSQFYKEVERDVYKIYQKARLKYNADKNPFI